MTYPLTEDEYAALEDALDTELDDFSPVIGVACRIAERAHADGRAEHSAHNCPKCAEHLQAAWAAIEHERERQAEGYEAGYAHALRGAEEAIRTETGHYRNPYTLTVLEDVARIVADLAGDE